MRIISYNVNGIRAAISKAIEWLQQANPDVICLQEIKATEDQILLKLLQMRAIRINIIILQPKGIQRCSNFVKNRIMLLGTGIDHMDFEGQSADFDDFSVMSLYLPSGTNIDRLDHKFKFMDDFQNYINEQKSKPKFDYLRGLQHLYEAIDIHDPVHNKYLVFTSRKIMA
jgi:exodeoxyribonuclease-3